MSLRPTLDLFKLSAHPAADLFPMLNDDELKELAVDIGNHGLHEPVWLYDDPERGWVLLDGRNRRAACEMASVEPTWRRYEGDDPIGFVLSLNLQRRHLTAGQRAALALDVMPLYEAEAKKRQGERTDLCADPHTSQPADSPIRSTDQAGKATGVSGRTVAQAKRLQEKAPDLLDKVKTGEVAIDRADRMLRDREAEAKRAEVARANPRPVELHVDLRHGDLRTVLADIPDGSVEAIITDPPYPAEYLPLLDDLRDLADRVLVPDGLLVVLFGQTHLPEVYRRLEGGRPYRWTGAYMTPGAGYSSHARRVQSNWKPLLVYGGGPRFGDVVTSAGDGGKEHHFWGQDYSAFADLILRMTEPGQTVLDPFMGAGTTLLAAHHAGRHVIGCDIDEEHVATAWGRFGLEAA